MDDADRQAAELLPCYFSHSCGNHELENHSMSNGDCPGWLRKDVAAKLREGEQREQWLHKRVEELAEECVAFEDRIAALEAQIEPCVRRGGPTECDQRDLHAEQQQERIAALEAEVDKLNEIILRPRWIS